MKDVGKRDEKVQQGGEGAAHRSRVSIPAVEVDVPGRWRLHAEGDNGDGHITAIMQTGDTPKL